jgi:hypothetical protein
MADAQNSAPVSRVLSTHRRMKQPMGSSGGCSRPAPHPAPHHHPEQQRRGPHPRPPQVGRLRQLVPLALHRHLVVQPRRPFPPAALLPAPHLVSMREAIATSRWVCSFRCSVR